MKKWALAVLSSLTILSFIVHSAYAAPKATMVSKIIVKYTKYTVKKGDTLTSIGKKYHMLVLDLKKLNHLTTDKIKINQALQVKTISTVLVALISAPKLDSLSSVSSANVSSYTITGTGVVGNTSIVNVKDSLSKIVSSSSKIDTKGKFSFHLNLTNLKDGNLVVEVYQKDSRGNISLATSNVLIKDTLAPSILVNLSAINNDNQNAYLISGVTESNSSVTLSLNDGVQSVLTKSITSNNNGLFSNAFDVHLLNDGKLKITTVAKDRFGNNRSYIINVTKDTVGPNVSISPADISYDNQYAYTVNGSTENNSNVDISISDGVHPVLSQKIKSDSTGNFSSAFDVHTLNNGPIIIHIKGYDAYQNISQSVFTVTKTDVLPTMDFSKGINLNSWFSYNFGNDVNTFYNDNDAKQLKDLGYTYVRLPVDPDYIWDYTNHTLKNMDIIKKAIDTNINQGIAVTLDLHPTDTIVSKQNDPATQQEMVLLWKALTKEYRSYPNNELSFELFNEPNFTGISTWQNFMQQTIDAIRTIDSSRTLLVDSNEHSKIETLTSIQPFNDKNIIYVFHFYDSFVFTHQGWEWWDGSAVKELSNVPYPSSPQIVAPLLTGLSADAQSMLKWYGSENWNQQKMEQTIIPVVKWRDQYQTKVIVNEFGVYKKYAPTQDRLNWLHDVRTTVEKYNIGWASWGYDDNQFGIFSPRSISTGMRTIEDGVIDALGLNGSIADPPATINPAPNPYIVTDGLLGYWNTKQGLNANSWSNIAPNGTILSGTLHNTTVEGATGALSFDGSTSTVSLFSGTTPTSFDFTGVKPFSVEAWIKPNTVDTRYRKIINFTRWNSSTDNGGYSLEVSNGKVYLNIFNGSITSCPVAISAGELTHIVATYDGSYIKIYKNGILVNSVSYTAGVGQMSTLSATFGGTDYYDGLLNVVRIYNKALTPSEITSNYSHGTEVALP